MNKSDFVFSFRELESYLGRNVLTPTESSGTTPFFLLIPKYYVDLINWDDPNDPLRKMVVTSNLEADTHEYEREDPIGDKTHSPVPGIVHRYPDRCLLNLTNICAVHCRFCFRRNLLDKNTAHMQQSLEYIRNHAEIWEVILSGGDPFMYTDTFLGTLLQKIRDISHVRMIRFHTRTPAVYPARVTESFADIVASASPATVVLHVNHPRELTPLFSEAVMRLKHTGVMLLSQTVLMKDINNDTATLTQLFRGLVEIGVKPYYLHHLDVAAGTHHFRVSVEEGKKLIQSLRGTISGTCMPEYVLDTPGGNGKIPVLWFDITAPGTYEADNFQGKRIQYVDPAHTI